MMVNDTRKYGFDDQHPKRVSFILVTKNREKYLPQALENARRLVSPNDEFIVVDGGSSDNTVNIVKSYKDMIDVFISEPDLSGEHAHNKGILIARGKYIRQIGDDDITYSEAMEQAVSVLEDHPEVDILICGGTKQHGPKRLTYYHPPGTNYGSHPEDAFKYKAPGVGFVIRRNVFARVGLVSDDLVASDNEFIARCINKGVNVKFCRINLFNHPVYSHSLIRIKKHSHEQDQYRLIRQYCSITFYIKYRFKRFSKNNLFMRYIMIFFKRLLRFIKIKILKRSLPEKKYIWDGGFS